MKMKVELWMTIPECEDYKISSHGRVYSLKRNKELKSGLNNVGYYIIFLRINGKPKGFTIHRLVAMTFFEEDITKKQIDHIDGDRKNNFFQNLRVCSNQQNNFNKGKNKNNQSGYKGVSWNNNRKKWCSQIKINGKTKHLGRFNDKNEAYEKYKEAAKYYHGDYLYQYL
jgi:hypothetical protein